MLLPQPFSVLAPMEDVTDTVFRQMVRGIAPPDLYMTEFVNVDGICHFLSSRAESRDPSVPLRFSRDDNMQNPVMRRLCFAQIERPILAQIWGSDPEKFFEAASFIKDLGFDGIDINMGCPQKDVMKCGGGSALIGDNVSVRVRVKEIIEAVKRAAPGMPISVKTRIGNKKIITEDWISFLLEQDLNMLTVHLRTAVEQSGVPAHWEEMTKIIRLRNQTLSSRAKSRDPSVPLRFSRDDNGQTIKIVGNGDVKNYKDGKHKCEEFGCDGFMIGRGVLTNPAAFSHENEILNIEDRIKLLGDHINLWEETWGDKKDFQILKKFVKAYINGFDGAAALRAKLMEASSIDQLRENSSV